MHGGSKKSLPTPGCLRGGLKENVVVILTCNRGLRHNPVLLVEHNASRLVLRRVLGSDWAGYLEI